MKDTVTWSLWSRSLTTGEISRESLWDSEDLSNAKGTLDWMNTHSHASFRNDKVYFLMESRTTHRPYGEPVGCDYDCSYCYMDEDD